MVKNRLKLIVRLGISLLLVGYLTFKVQWTPLLHALRQVDPLLYIASTLLTAAASFFLACKYHLLIRDSVISHSIGYLIKVNFISRFYALFLPSAVGAQAVRWYKVTRNQNGRSFFLAATLFERLTFVFTLLLFGSIPLLAYSSPSTIASLRVQIFPVVIVSLIFICIAVCYFVFPAMHHFINAGIARIISLFWNSRNVPDLLNNFSLNKTGPSLFIYMLALSFAWQILFLSRMFVLFKAASIPLNFIDVAWMGSLVLLLQVLPISFAGIGVREGAYAYLLTLYGFQPEKGVLIGILFFSQMLILAGIGGMLEAMEK
jgi:uncharacterized protein (TIRG00374 family)